MTREDESRPVIVIGAVLVLALMIAWGLWDRHLTRARARSRPAPSSRTPRQYLVYGSVAVALIIGGWIVLHAR